MKLNTAVMLIVLAFVFCGNGVKNDLNDENWEYDWEWIVKPEEYEDCFFLNEDLIAVKKSNGKYGIIDSEKEFVFTQEYDAIGKYSEGIACVQNDGKCFYINLNGEKITDAVFQEVKCFQESKGPVKINGKWGYINEEGRVIIACNFEEVHLFYEGMAAVKLKDKWGFINSKGKDAVTCIYDEVRDFKEGCAAVRKGDKWGFIDKAGNIIAECEYSQVKDFSENATAVMKNGKWGFINQSGQTIIPLIYDDAGSFSEGKAAVKQNKYLEGYMDAWAYINPKGEVVIDFYPYMAVEGRMPWVGEFHNGMAFVSDDFYGVIDEEGNWLFNGHESEFFLSSLVYDDAHDAIPAYTYTDSSMKDKKYGLVGIDGKQRLEPVFDYVDGICGDYVWISNVINNQWKYGIIKLTMKQYN